MCLRIVVRFCCFPDSSIEVDSSSTSSIIKLARLACSLRSDEKISVTLCAEVVSDLDVLALLIWLDEKNGDKEVGDNGRGNDVAGK